MLTREREVDNLRTVVDNCNFIGGDYMSGRDAQIAAMKAAGYVVQSEAAKLAGRSNGSNIPDLMDKYGVSGVTIQPTGCKPLRMWMASEIDKVPPVNRDKLPGGQSNGGMLYKRLGVVAEKQDETISTIEKLESTVTLLAECITDLADKLDIAVKVKAIAEGSEK